MPDILHTNNNYKKFGGKTMPLTIIRNDITNLNVFAWTGRLRVVA
jgi:hypothetical protein